MNAEAYRRSLPHFGQLALLCTLLGGAGLSAYFITVVPELHPLCCRNPYPVSLLGLVLPESVLLAPALRRSFGALFLLMAPLWYCRRWLPYSPWLCTLGFTGMIACFIEGATQVTHVAHLANLALFVHLTWYALLAEPIRTAQANGQFWRTPLYPAWAKWQMIYAIGVFYGFSGWMKIASAGFGWANGISMQLWVHVFGDPESVFTPMLLSYREVAWFLQVMTLIAEAGAPLAIFWPRTRIWLGLMLISFHIGAISVFRWGFHANAVLIALYFLPAERAVDWLRSRYASSPQESPA